jgi:hypothetical protein
LYLFACKVELFFFWGFFFFFLLDVMRIWSAES